MNSTIAGADSIPAGKQAEKQSSTYSKSMTVLKKAGAPAKKEAKKGLDEKEYRAGYIGGNMKLKSDYRVRYQLQNETHKKVKKKGGWLFKYMFRRLERDAWLDVFPDSDSFGGKTDVQGHELVLEYGLTDGVVLGLDYYRMKRISHDDDQNVLQIDLNFDY